MPAVADRVPWVDVIAAPTPSRQVQLPPTRSIRGRLLLLVCLLGMCSLGTCLLGVWAPPAAADAIDADHNRTRNMVSAYQRAPNWVVKAMALLGLGDRWHPEGNCIVLDALRSKDRRLQAFGLEAYRGVALANLPVLLTAEVLDELTARHGKERHRFFRSYLYILLSRAFPVAADSGKGWSAWWAGVRAGYAPPAWREKSAPGASDRPARKTVARKSVVTRALELSRDGIELVLVFDSTGSMQPTIDAARAAMTPVVEILKGLSSELKVGLVHYKDRGDLGGGSGRDAGAEVEVKLVRNLHRVRKHLEKLRASGGGDIPERVYGGLWLALQRDMGWTLPACKMVVVIGDAPPHGEDVEPALQLVRRAREDPVGQLARKRTRRAPVTTSRDGRGGKPKGRVRPILTSALWTGPAPVKREPDEDAPEDEGPEEGEPGGLDPWPGLFDLSKGIDVFQRLAEEGGGVFATLRRRSSTSEASAKIVAHLVGLTFGAAHEEAARLLAERYMFWRGQAFFK